MRKLAGWALLAGSLMAAPRLVTVQDTLYKADGTKFNGVVLIDWRSFRTSDNASIPTQSLVVPVTDGALRVLLAPTTTAQGVAYYDVRYNSDGRILFVEKWYVPPSTNILTLREVRAAADGTVPAGQTSILIGDVTGLQDELGARPTKDTSYAAGRVVIATSAGTIGSAFGSPADCVHVDGTSAPCGGGGTFTDSEVPIGTINGTNAYFSVSGTPSPAASLALFRNGILQKQGLDYSLNSNTITFVTAAIPQAGDVLIASYRQGSASGAINTSPSARALAPDVGISPAAGPQIVCGRVGDATSSVTPVKLGTCTIPAEMIQPGDRFEVRYAYSHQGGAREFTFTVAWGSTLLVNRTATAADSVVVGRSEFIVATGGGLWNTLSWGSALPFAASAGATKEPVANGEVVNVYSQMSSSTQDTVALEYVSVVRYPNQSNP